MRHKLSRDGSFTLYRIGGKAIQPYWIFLIPAIVAALYSGKIDAAADVSDQLKGWLIVICIFLAITNIILIINL